MSNSVSNLDIKDGWECPNCGYLKWAGIFHTCSTAPKVPTQIRLLGINPEEKTEISKEDKERFYRMTLDKKL